MFVDRCCYAATRPNLPVLLVLLMLPALGTCQPTTTADPLAAKLEISQHLSQLELKGNESFHLVASFEAFDTTGKPLDKGSLDELWKGSGEYRKQLTLRSGALVKVSSAGKSWRTGQWTMQEVVALSVNAVLQPFFMKPLIEGHLSDVVSSRNDPSLECVGVEPVLAGVAPDTQLALTTYCLDKVSHVIRLISRPNSMEIVFNDYQPFGKQFIARTIQIGIGKQTVLRLHVGVLEKADDFRAFETPMPAGAQDLSVLKPTDENAPYVTGQLMHGQLLKRVEPAYSQALFPGLAVVKLHINTHGVVDTAEVIRCDSPVIKGPILSAVKQWRYRVSYRGRTVVADDQIVTFPPVGDANP